LNDLGRLMPRRACYVRKEMLVGVGAGTLAEQSALIRSIAVIVFLNSSNAGLAGRF